MKATIIIPAYNEENSIGKVLQRIQSVDKTNEWSIIVVDDCSTDNTVKIAEQYKIDVLCQPYNKGYGAALKAGIRAAKTDIIFFMDADGQHDSNDIQKLLDHIGVYDMVIGARNDGKGQYLTRKPGKWILGCLANYLSGHHIPDVNCGFRAIKRSCALEFMNLYPNGFSISTTMTLAMIKGGYNVKFVPIEVHARQGRKSTVKQGYDGTKTLLLILRCVVLFNPLKVFFPMFALLFTSGLAFTMYSIFRFHKVSNSAIIIFLSSLIIFFFGLIADQISLMRSVSK